MPDEKELEALILFAKEHKLTRLLVADEEFAVDIALPPGAPRPLKPEAAAEQPPAQTGATVEVKAAVVGYFRNPSENLRVGAVVDGNAPLGEIETLGLSNPVTAPSRGRVREVYIEEGQPVQYGQVIAVLEEVKA
ncbi:MAG: acetyl-CoA carboxylase biotin carboxyl carrier protein subunit [Armatimonadota bacterium]